MSSRQNKVMVPPIVSSPSFRRFGLTQQNFIFKLLQQSTPVKVWLYEQLDSRIEGRIRGFDEFMNIVIDDAVSVSQKDGKEGKRRELGRIMLKGSQSINLQQNVLTRQGIISV